MTEINFAFSSYYTLPHISLDEITGRGFDPRLLGLYDKVYGIRNPTYVPGKFIDEKGGTEYPDDAYRDKHAVLLAFKHKPMGNFPILRNMGDGHFHEKYIVSTNSIDPFDVMKEDEYGNITFKANLVKDPPHSITLFNNTQLTLVEIEPYGTPEDLAKLAKDARFMAKIVEDNKKAQSDVYFHRNENKLLLTRVAGAGSTIMLLQDKINAILQQMEIMQDSFIDMQLEVRDKMSKGIKGAEGKYAFNAAWDKVHDQDITKTIATIKADIRKINSLVEADGMLSDGQKQLLFTQVANVLSPDYMRRSLGNLIPQTIETAKGQQTVYRPTEPTPTNEAFSYMKDHAEGRLSDEQLLQNIRNIITRKEEEQTPNAATQKTEERPIVLDNRGRQVPYYGNQQGR